MEHLTGHMEQTSGNTQASSLACLMRWVRRWVTRFMRAAWLHMQKELLGAHSYNILLLGAHNYNIPNSYPQVNTYT